MNVTRRTYIVVLLAAMGAVAQAQQVTYNQQGPAAVVIKQPTTVVEASPLSDSRAEQMRRQRQETEVQTEQKIVEKLEQSRIEDEKARAERLFGNKLDKQEAPTYSNNQVPAAQVIAVDAEKSNAAQIESVKKEIIEAIKDKEAHEAEAKTTVVIEAVQPAPKVNRTYFSGLLGNGGYNNVNNVEGKGAAGILIGVEMPNRIAVEASFLYSNYFIDQAFWNSPGAIFKEMHQYNIGGAVKYSVFDGAVRPFIGGQMSYVYRRYQDRFYYGPGFYGSLPSESQANSNAIDMGVSMGVDVFLNDTFAVGIEYKYNTNMTYRSDSEIIGKRVYYRSSEARPVEETDYWTTTVSGKFRF